MVIPNIYAGGVRGGFSLMQAEAMAPIGRTTSANKASPQTAISGQLRNTIGLLRRRRLISAKGAASGKLASSITRKLSITLEKALKIA